MRLNPKLILIMSMLSGVLAFMIINQMLEQANQPQEKIMVVMATASMNVGEVIDPEKIKLSPAPSDLDLEVAYRDPTMVEGKLLRNSIRPGQPVLIFDIADEKEDVFALIPEGYRASTITVRMPEDLIDLLSFGTRVDVLFTDTTSDSVTAKTIMENVLVMKVSESGGGIPNPLAGGQKKEVYVTLAVPPKAVETLAYAVEKGKLDLSILPHGNRNFKEIYMSMNDILDIRDDSGVGAIQNRQEIQIIKGTKKYMVEL